MGPLVFAHRGSSGALAEHTLDAYRLAIDEGVDGVECDVRLTRDGHVVCIHDRRLDRTSNGRGRVSAATLDELDRLDFASWHTRTRNPVGWAMREGAAAPTGAAPSGVLTLDRLLVTALDAGRPLRLLIETKHPSRFGAAVEERVVRLLERYGLSRPDPAAPVRAAVMSFSPLAVRRLRVLEPALPTGFLFEIAPPGLRAGRSAFGADISGPSIGVVRAHPEVVRRAHERGRQVYVWTVNSREDVDLVLRLGVDGIISDRPSYVLSRLGR